jgi:hypothetical protein
MAAMTAAEMQAKIKMRISILQSRSPMENKARRGHDQGLGGSSAKCCVSVEAVKSKQQAASYLTI